MPATGSSLCCFHGTPCLPPHGGRPSPSPSVPEIGPISTPQYFPHQSSPAGFTLRTLSVCKCQKRTSPHTCSKAALPCLTKPSRNLLWSCVSELVSRCTLAMVFDDCATVSGKGHGKSDCPLAAGHRVMKARLSKACIRSKCWRLHARNRTHIYFCKLSRLLELMGATAPSIRCLRKHLAAAACANSHL